MQFENEYQELVEFLGKLFGKKEKPKGPHDLDHEAAHVASRKAMKSMSPDDHHTAAQAHYKAGSLYHGVGWPEKHKAEAAKRATHHFKAARFHANAAHKMLTDRCPSGTTRDPKSGVCRETEHAVHGRLRPDADYGHGITRSDLQRKQKAQLKATGTAGRRNTKRQIKQRKRLEPGGA